MEIERSNKKVLGVFRLVMINVIAVDSIRTLSFSAEYGFSLVFFYILAALTFFIPSALVSAELGSTWPKTGGIYVWVKEAFGDRWSVVIIWLNWIYNVVWYPTIMALLAGTMTYFFNPALASNKLYMVGMILFLFWGATYINCLGMRASSSLSSVSALLGTIFPMIVISIFGLIWIFSGNDLEITLGAGSFFPSWEKIDNLAFLSNVLFGLVGLEMAATHAAEMKNPTKDYPRALAISVIIILLTIVLGSLGIAVVVPHNELSLVTGVLQALNIFLNKFNLSFLTPLAAFFIILGGLGGVGAWIIGPTKGLMTASKDGMLPIGLAKTNKQGVPVRILMIQGSIVSVLCIAFLIMPSVNASFWLLSAITAQLAMVVYFFLFLSAMKLRFSHPTVKRPFKIPFGTAGMIVTSALGALACLATIVFGFIPPKSIGITKVFNYECSLIGGMVLMCLVPLVITQFLKNRSER